MPLMQKTPQEKPNPSAAMSTERRYEKIQVLYSGTHGCVKLCVDKKTGEKVAIKFIERGPQIDEDVECGILNHMALLHQHIVTFKEVFLTSTHLCVVMQYAPGGDLLEFVRSRGVNESQGRWLFQQLIIALDYCHRMGIVCREIKLENTLLDSNAWPLLKLNAFHYSKRLGMQDAVSLLRPKGSPVYLAPEMIEPRSTSRCSSFRAIDMWECGVFLYTMLFQSYPFCHVDDQQDQDPLNKVLERTARCDFDFAEEIVVSPECKDLIRRMLTHAKDRITLDEVIQHPWFVKDLPVGALEMNHNARLRKGTRHQSKMDIANIINEARTPSFRQA